VRTSGFHGRAKSLLGSVRAKRAGERVLAIVNFS